jgi:hypothetical protein
MPVEIPTLQCAVHTLEDPRVDAPAVTVINGNALCGVCSSYVDVERWGSETPELGDARAEVIRVRAWKEARRRGY